MEATWSTPASNCHILTNSPALHSLKRQQLVKLCKRNGIKASGKNSEIVEKLKAHASNHPLDASFLASQSLFSSDGEEDKENKKTFAPRPSETWTVIEEDSREVERVHLGLKGIQEEVEQEIMPSLKGFGAPILSGDFGNGTTSSKGSSMTSSIKAFASSLKRNGSKMSIEPASGIKFATHLEEGPFFQDTLTTNSTPYHSQPLTYPPLPSPQPLDADDSRDQSMLDFGASTVRLVMTAPTAPSPPALRPFTPTFECCYSPGSTALPSLDEESDPIVPGGFPSVTNTPSGHLKQSSPLPPPFLFGSPAHRVSNTQFHSAAASVLAEMNVRLGLTGTGNEVGLDLLQNRSNASQPASLPTAMEHSKANITNKFDRAHARQFEKMEGLGDWYARRQAGSPSRSESQHAGKKRKSDKLGDPHKKPIGPIGQSNTHIRRTSRVVTPGTRRSLVNAAETEEMDGRQVKRVRISTVEGENKKIRNEDAASQDDEQTAEQRERERAAIKKRLEMSRARRRSSMGRVSVGGSRPPLNQNQPKKGITTKFGFLSSAKSLVKSVWNGVGTSAPKPSTSVSVSKPSQPANGPVVKKSFQNVLTKPGPAAKATVSRAPSVSKTSTAKPDSNTSLRVPKVGIGLGRKLSTRTGSTTSTLGTRSSVGDESTSAIPAVRRGPIPSFQPPSGRVSRTSSLATSGGTLASRTSSNGTIGSQGSSGASSIGMRNGLTAGSVRSSNARHESTSSMAKKRTSTLFAPTASSLAKMQSTVKPPSLSRAASQLSSTDTAAEYKTSAKVKKASSIQNADADAIPQFTFASPPPIGGPTTPNGGTGAIFGTPLVSLTQLSEVTTVAPSTKPRDLPLRRPRISRSRVIAKVGAQRAASGSSSSSLARTASGRRSMNVPRTRGSFGVRVSGMGGGVRNRDSAAREAAAMGMMSARKRLRQSDIVRRRSRLSGETSSPVAVKEQQEDFDS